MFGLAGGKDAAYTNMSVQQNLSATAMNLARLAVMDIVAQNNLVVRNSVSAGNAVNAQGNVNSGQDVAGASVTADTTVDAGGSVTTGEDLNAVDGTLSSNSVNAIDDGRFASVYLNGTEVSLGLFPSAVTGSLAYYQSLADPPFFSSRYIQSYTSYTFSSFTAFSFFKPNVPAGEYILNFQMGEFPPPNITYIIDGVSYYNPYSATINPFIRFTHPGGVLSVSFAVAHTIISLLTLPADSMVVSQFVEPTVLPTLFTFANVGPLSFVATGETHLQQPSQIAVTIHPQPGVTLEVSGSGDEWALGVGAFNEYRLAQYIQCDMGVDITRTSGGVGTFYATLFTLVGGGSNVDSTRTRQIQCVAIPNPNVPYHIFVPSQNHSFLGSYTMEIYIVITDAPIDNFFASYTPVPVDFTLTNFAGAFQMLLYPPQ